MSASQTAVPGLNVPAPLPPPPVIPGFEIGPLLGSGAMGRVYRARDVESRREVAIKWLDGTAGDELRNRFQREAKAASGLQHPNIVGVFGSGRTHQGDFMVMELVDGFPLAVALDARALGMTAVAEIGAKVARALEAAHAAGVVHRDVKPGNILLDQRSEPRLVDFGLARFVDEKGALTGPQAVMGTLAYMSPEVARGGAADAGPASDVFSLGCVLYEGFSGKPPFLAERFQDTLKRVQEANPGPLPPEVPPALAALVLETLAKKPAQRPTAGALAQRLEMLSIPIASTATPVTPQRLMAVGGQALGSQPLGAAKPMAPPVGAGPRSTAAAPKGATPSAPRVPGAPAIPPTRAVPAEPSPENDSVNWAGEGRGPLILVGGLFLTLAVVAAFLFMPKKSPEPEPTPPVVASPSPLAVAPTPEASPVADDTAAVASEATPAPAPSSKPDLMSDADELAGLDALPAPSPEPTPTPSPQTSISPQRKQIDEDVVALWEAARKDEREETIRIAHKLLLEVPASDRAIVAGSYGAMGRAQLLLGRHKLAKESFTEALDRDPANRNALFGQIAEALLERNIMLAEQRVSSAGEKEFAQKGTLLTTARTLISIVSGKALPRATERMLKNDRVFDPAVTRFVLTATGKK